MKVYTLGSGFVGQHLPYIRINDHLECSAYSIEKLLDTHLPDVIVNCIGKTGAPNVDWCESNKSITAETNTALPILLAEICEKKSIHLVHIGSGCIFYGQSPNVMHVKQEVPPYEHVVVDMGWKETDFANPESFYSKTKYACDLALGSMKNVVTLRIRMPLSEKNVNRNLINKLKKYNKIINIDNSVTFMSDLVKCVDWAIKNGESGIYHVTNPQPITAAEIMKEYQKYVPEHQFKIIDEQELGSLTIAKRSNCILNTDKLNQAGFHMTLAKEALKQCMSDYIKNI